MPVHARFTCSFPIQMPVLEAPFKLYFSRTSEKRSLMEASPSIRPFYLTTQFYPGNLSPSPLDRIVCSSSTILQHIAPSTLPRGLSMKLLYCSLAFFLSLPAHTHASPDPEPETRGRLTHRLLSTMHHPLRALRRLLRPESPAHHRPGDQHLVQPPELQLEHHGV